MKRLGLLGGTFDPIHLGHLLMAQAVQEKMRLDKVIFIPSFLPPHKRSREVTPARHRFQMVQLAIQENPVFGISSFEIDKEGRSYSIDTAVYFTGAFPKSRLFFIVGFDAFVSLKTWKNIDGLLKMVQFVVVNRPGDFKNADAIQHQAVEMPAVDISSSAIRQRSRQGKAIRYLVPDAVEQYIREHRLYH